MIVLDANILVSAVIGRSVPRVLADARVRGVALGAADVQFVEAWQVLSEKLGLSAEEAGRTLGDVTALLEPLRPELYRPMEERARQRLHERAQSDWPVLAAALATSGGIWSHDRDFFGVGVPVWSSRNIRFAN